MRGFLASLLTIAAFVLVADTGRAATQSVFVDTAFDFVSNPFNPGCGGCGLQDWDDFYNNGWRCRRLPANTIGGTCGRSTPDPPVWDDGNALFGTLQLKLPVDHLYIGLATEAEHEHDPSVDGEILSVVATFAFRLDGVTGSFAPATLDAHLLVVQDGNSYISSRIVRASGGPGPGPWEQFDPTALGSGDFDRVVADGVVDPGQHPDFSVGAPALRFGFAVDMGFSGQILGPPFDPGFIIRNFELDAFVLNLSSPSHCSDGLDNDGDGLTDFPSDPACFNANAASETTACDNGVDDDGDGNMDFPADLGCAAGWWTVEDPECDDGADNDGDGDIDTLDAQCNGEAWRLAENPACQDGIDNDGDGQTDLDDPECQGPLDTAEACGLGAELVLPGLLWLRRRRANPARP